MGSVDLQAQVLRRLKPLAHPDVLVGIASPDDAGVYRVREDLAIILTVDFFPPIVDEARTYGAIAAANSLSDVYAMGGEPLAALNVVAFPTHSDDLPLDLLGEILEGGCAKAAEAGVPVIGGHTVDDAEPKYGLAVIGRVCPEAIVRKGGARPGDQLIITKPLGTGILTAALKRGERTEAELSEAIEAMTTLNREAAAAMIASGVRAATDITGYGLLGHLAEMLHEGGVGARLSFSTIPLLRGALELAGRGVVPGGTRRNLAAAQTITTWTEDLGEAERLVLADAQTSGGLLVALPPAAAEELLERLKKPGFPPAAIVGEITSSPGIRIET